MMFPGRRPSFRERRAAAFSLPVIRREPPPTRPLDKITRASHRGASGAVMERRAIVIQGIVQGVGFRPFVYGLATCLRLGGYVQNRTGSVLIEVEGEPASLERFRADLTRKPPPWPGSNSSPGSRDWGNWPNGRTLLGRRPCDVRRSRADPILPVGYTLRGNLTFRVTHPEYRGGIGLKKAFSDQSFFLAVGVEEFFGLLREPPAD